MNNMKELDPNKFLPVESIEKLLGPSCDAIGQGIGGIFYWTFSKLIKIGIIKKAEFDDLTRKTANALSEIPENKRDTSNPGLIMKAIEESKYQLNKEDLRSIFAKLIASSADNRKNHFITPRYATVLSQLGVDDAKFLQLINSEKEHRMVAGELRLSNQRDYSYRVISPLYVYTENDEIKQVSMKVINILVSLGVIDFSNMITIAGKDAANKYKQLSDFLLNRNWNDKEDLNNKYEFTPESINVTAFGERLLNCIF